MRLRLVVFGVEVFALELCRQDPTELLADAIVDMSKDSENGDGDGLCQFGWGASPHIERSPETEYWSEDKFGFRSPPLK